MAEFTQYLTSGLALGAIYGLVALGFVVIYRASQVFNFAHGELLTFGAVVMVFLSAPAASDVGEGLGAPTVRVWVCLGALLCSCLWFSPA